MWEHSGVCGGLVNVAWCVYSEKGTQLHYSCEAFVTTRLAAHTQFPFFACLCEKICCVLASVRVLCGVGTPTL